MKISDDFIDNYVIWIHGLSIFYLFIILFITNIVNIFINFINSELNFNNFDYFIISLVSFTVMLLFYFKIREYTDKTEKRSAWILTLPCAILCSFGCIYKVKDVIISNYNSDFIYANDKLSQFLVLYFINYLICDSIVMQFHYKTIGGLLHHIPYGIFMIITIIYKCPSVFVIFFPLEISTIPLSIGYIWPKWRFNILFGILFLYFRILYHAFMCIVLYKTRDKSPLLIWPFTCIPWFVHIYWFIKWFKSFYKKNI